MFLHLFIQGLKENLGSVHRLTSALRFINSTLKQLGHQIVTVTKKMKTLFFPGFVFSSDLTLVYHSDILFLIFFFWSVSVEIEVYFCKKKSWEAGIYSRLEWFAFLPLKAAVTSREMRQWRTAALCCVQCALLKLTNRDNAESASQNLQGFLIPLTFEVGEDVLLNGRKK